MVWGVGRFGTQQYLMAWSYFQPKYELFILTKGAILRKLSDFPHKVPDARMRGEAERKRKWNTVRAHVGKIAHAGRTMKEKVLCSYQLISSHLPGI